MIAYLDTSAFVPLLLTEEGSESSRSLWSNASTVISTRLLYVEAAAAIARSSREKDLPPDEVNTVVASLVQRWRAVVPIEVGTGLVEAAAEAALRFGLRGYDSVHCAAAALVRGDEVVAASSDRQLLAAWRNLGLATFDPLG